MILFVDMGYGVYSPEVSTLLGVMAVYANETIRVTKLCFSSAYQYR